jgi:hypothetical protein
MTIVEDPPSHKLACVELPDPVEDPLEGHKALSLDFERLEDRSSADRQDIELGEVGLGYSTAIVIFVCEEHLSVHHFEGQEENVNEIEDLPAEINPITVEDQFGCELPCKRVRKSLDFIKDLLEDVQALSVFVECQFRLFAGAEQYEKGQKVVWSACGRGGLTLNDMGHLLRPPGDVFRARLARHVDFDAFVDCALRTSHGNDAVFGTGWSCVGLRGSVGSIEGKSGQTRHKTCAVLPWNLISGLFGHVCFFLSSCASFFVSFFIYYCPCGLYCISYGL